MLSSRERGWLLNCSRLYFFFLRAIFSYSKLNLLSWNLVAFLFLTTNYRPFKFYNFLFLECGGCSSTYSKAAQANIKMETWKWKQLEEIFILFVIVLEAVISFLSVSWNYFTQIKEIRPAFRIRFQILNFYSIF